MAEQTIIKICGEHYKSNNALNIASQSNDEDFSDYAVLETYLKNSGARNIMLVCGLSIKYLRVNDFIAYYEKKYGSDGVKIIRFSDFEPNPSYDSVVKGVRIFNEENCDMIFAVGGGSAMDVAKCIKLFAYMDDGENYLKQKIAPNDIKLIAMPTTAGTGSEATRYAVIYYNGEKQSVSDYSCIPEAAVMDVSALKSLPPYQKKATMSDALCHAIESFWSVNSTQQSKAYSKEAIKLIMDNGNAYLNNDEEGSAGMLEASYMAGKAINITQTTAGHAMCYKLTTMYGISHGHACALCVAALWKYMVENTDKCIDSRGQSYLETMFKELAQIFGCDDSMDAALFYQNFLDGLEFDVPIPSSEDDFAILKNSVNPVRLKNNPVKLTPETIDMLYHQILRRRI